MWIYLEIERLTFNNQDFTLYYVPASVWQCLLCIFALTLFLLRLLISPLSSSRLSLVCILRITHSTWVLGKGEVKKKRAETCFFFFFYPQIVLSRETRSSSSNLDVVYTHDGRRGKVPRRFFFLLPLPIGEKGSGTSRGPLGRSQSRLQRWCQKRHSTQAHQNRISYKEYMYMKKAAFSLW